MEDDWRMISVYFMRFRVENVYKSNGVNKEDVELGKDDEKVVRLRMVDLFTLLIIEY